MKWPPSQSSPKRAISDEIEGEETVRERELAKARRSGISSYKFALGRAHEEFC